MKGINGHELPYALRHTGRLEDALAHCKLMKITGAPPKDIAKALVRKLKESEKARR